jgi:hypothetical protein
MPLYCPFCHAAESERVLATDEDGKEVVLLMFDCPFFMKLEASHLESDERAQHFLNQWRMKEGDRWLESIGPILRQREMRNIERYSSRVAA